MRNQSENSCSNRAWETESTTFEVWKYYASVGGADKTMMIQITTWLLGFSAAILGFLSTGKLTILWAAELLICLGILISCLAAFVTLLYGGYATWNWAIADQIAKDYNWSLLLPKHNPIPKRTGPSRAALRLAKPCSGKVAPIFWFFFMISIGSAGLHTVLLYRVLRGAVQLTVSACNPVD
jgi:hypothetical protein